MQLSTPHLKPGKLLVLLAILCVGAGLRGWQATDSLWLDELHTGWSVSGTWSEVSTRAAAGNQSPCYFWLVWVWTRVFGQSELVLRFPSLLTGIALIATVFWVVSRWTDCRWSPAMCALLVALDPHQVFFSQEARPYALVQLIGLLQLTSCVRLLAGPPKTGQRATFVIATLVGFYLHYTSLLLLSGELVAWAVVSLRSRQPKTAKPDEASKRFAETAYRSRHLLADGFIILIGILPALPHLWDIAQRRSNWSAFIGQPGPLGMIQLLSLDVYLVLPLAGWGLSQITRARRSRPSLQRILIFCWFAVPLLLVWSLNSLDILRMFHRRYLIATTIGPVLLCGIWLAHLTTRRQKFVMAGLLCLAVQQGGMARQWLIDGRFLKDRNQDWRAAVAYLNREAKNTTPSGRSVLVGSGLIESNALPNGGQALVDYCLLPVTGTYRLTSSYHLSALSNQPSQPLTVKQLQTILPQRSYWSLLNARPASVEKRLDHWRTQWQRRGWQTAVAYRRFGSLTLLRIDLRSQSTTVPPRLSAVPP